MTEVLCCGTVNLDEVLHIERIPDPDFSQRIDRIQESCGGSAANTAFSLNSLGIDASVVASVGSDRAGEKVKKSLREKGIEPRLQDAEVTTIIKAIITKNADPRYLHMNTESTSINPNKVSLSGVDHVHVTSFDKKAATKISKKAKNKNKTVSFNPTQGYEEESFWEVIENSDYVFLNDRELNICRNRHSLGKIVNNTNLITTHGSAGSSYYESIDEQITHSGYDAGNVVDTIGAGDCFIGGYLSVILEEENNHKKALKKGNAAGCLSIQKTGGPNDIDREKIKSMI